MVLSAFRRTFAPLRRKRRHMVTAVGTLDINSDMGESFGPYTMGDDFAMLDVVTTANVACGFHGGDPDVMAKTMDAAKARGVAVGAHPGFPDLWGFGRRRLPYTTDEIVRFVAYQIGADAAKTVDPDLALLVMSGTQLERAGSEAGLRLVYEIYADRAYTDEGQLVSRKLPGAVIHDPQTVAWRVVEMVGAGAVICASGKRLPAKIESVCVHGDTPGAVAI